MNHEWTRRRRCLAWVAAGWLLVAPFEEAAAAEVPNSSAKAAVRPFHLERRGPAWWLVSPEGKRFFSLGVCVVTQGASRESYDPENPGYAAWKHYATAAEWSEAVLRRLASWRFTTIGGWSEFRGLGESKGPALYLTPVLHVGSTAGVPWWDMWDPAIIARMERVARDQILPLRDHPRLLGYYSDNEMGWWNAALWKMTLEHRPTSGQRQRLLLYLRQTYGEDWGKLQADFESVQATDWATLEQGGLLYARPGSNACKVMRGFLGLMAERYYQLVHEIIRQYDPRALVLGDRYQSFYYPEVVRAAARWVDAISSNLNAHWSDGSYLRCYLETLHQLSGRPILVSEFYAAAQENRTGNRNSQGVFPVVATQTQRASTARTTLSRLVRTPYVLGADWFQYFDEPVHGRDDGENFNFGLVDIHDRPYEALTAVFAGLDATALKAETAPPLRDASSGVPPAPPNPLADFAPTRALQPWDREGGYVPCASPHPLADLYVCWDTRAVYLGLYAQDVTEDALYRDHVVPENDRALWEVRVPGHPPWRLRLGAGRPPVANDPSLKVAHLSGVNLTVRSVTALALPAAQLGRKSFQAGDRVTFSSTFWTHGRCYQMDWTGAFTLSAPGVSHRVAN